MTFTMIDINQAGDYSSGKVDNKEITLSGEGGEEKVEIYKKPSLFSKNFKVSKLLFLVKMET